MSNSFFVKRDTDDGHEYVMGVDEDGHLHTVRTFVNARMVPEDAADYLVRHLAENGLSGFYKSEVLGHGSSEDDPEGTVH